MQDYAGEPGNDDLQALVREWRRAVPEAGDASGDSATMVIAAVRELASDFKMTGESAGQHGATVPGGRMALPTAVELISRPARLAQYLSLVAMLAATVAALSRESARPETKFLTRWRSASDPPHNGVAGTVSHRVSSHA